MPPVVATVASAIGTFLWTATWVTVAKAALFVAAIVYSSNQQRKMRRAIAAANASLDTGRTVNVRDPLAPRRIIYGQVLVGGAMPYMSVSGSENEYLHLIIKLADHECEELGTVYFDGVEVPLDGSGNATGTFAGYARVKKFLGLAAGERDTALETETSGEWTANDLGKSVARLHVRLKHNPDLFTNAVPTITCLVKGKKVYDPRTGLTAYSNNAALCTADFLMDPRLGKGVPLSRIVTADLSEAANICEETVVLADSSTEERYTCNGVINSDEDPNDMLATLAGAMAGTVCDIGGKWTIRAGAWRSPVLTLTDDDLCGAMTVMPRLSRQDSFNGVRGTFYSPINNWAATDFPAVKNDTYMTWDGGVRLWHDVAYRFTTSPATAQRLAKIELERGRQQITISAPYMLRAMQCQPGDVVMVTRERLGWSNKYFEVVEWGFGLEPGKNGNSALVVQLTLRETAEAVWDWADGEETTVDLAENTNLLQPRTVPTPSTPTLSTSNFQQVDGTITPRLKVQWSAPSSAQVKNGGAVEVEYKKSADSDWIVWNPALRGDATLDYITDVLAGVSYDVRLRFRNIYGVRGNYSATATATVSTDTTAPNTPTGLTATPQLRSVSLIWDKNTESDLSFYEIARNNGGGWTVLATTKATRFVDVEVTLGTTYDYRLRAVDTSENYSGSTGTVSAAPSPVGTGDLADGAATTQKLANGAVSQVTAVLASSSNAIPNNSWTEVCAVVVNAAAGQDVVIQVAFAYADAGATHSTDFDLRVLRDGVEIDSQDQSVRGGLTDIVAWGTVDVDLASAVTEYTLEVRPRGGGSTATPDVRDPFMNLLVLKDRLN